MIRTVLMIVFGFACVAGAVSVLAQQNPYPPAKPQKLAPMGSLERGGQLVMLGGCDDCHTPKLQGGVPDMTRRFSGQPPNGPLPPEVAGAITTNMMLTAWRGPWGLTLAANISPDPATGIGKWSVEDFRKTIRTGVDPTGYVIRPPMPIAGFQNLPDQDLDAIFRYLKSQKPVPNAVGRSK